MILALLQAIAIACGASSQRTVVGPTYAAVEWVGGHAIGGGACPSWPNEACWLVISWADPRPLVDWGP